MRNPSIGPSAAHHLSKQRILAFSNKCVDAIQPTASVIDNELSDV
jgi:hypothetical protein